MGRNMDHSPSLATRGCSMNASTGKYDPSAPGVILIVSDSISDTDLIRTLLVQEFEHIFVSTNPDMEVQDFELRSPDVLVLAFNTLEKIERYYLGLYKLSTKIHLQPHRTVILCRKEEVNGAYQLCKKMYFNDYVLFWPATNDAPRLLMAVHHAFQNLHAQVRESPSVAEFAAQTRQLGQLNHVLDKQMAQGDQRIDEINRAIGKAEQEIGASLGSFTRKLATGEFPNIPAIKNIDALERAIAGVKANEIGPSISHVAGAVQPLREWKEEFRQECEPHIASANSLQALSKSIRPLILVVDDDEFQHNVLSKLLAKENYRLVFASSGIESLNCLHRIRPDLILMDIMMPDLDGIETTRRIKALQHCADIPVIMITGNSEGATVRDSLKAGAINFVVKPFERETLLTKFALALVG
jgi:CheY-like chemotaxis protein